MGKVYSPSQTSRAMRCPMLNSLYKEGWRNKHIGIPELAAIVGKGIALGLGVYNNYRYQLEQSGRQIDSLSKEEAFNVTQYACDVALRHAHEELEDYEKYGFIWAANSDVYFSSVQDRIRATLIQYIQNDPIKPEWRIISAEHELGEEYGNARIDLVFSENGLIRLLDYKSKSQYKPRYEEADWEKYRNSFQMLHYSWAYQDKYKVEIDQYYICQIVTQGYRCELRPFPINQEALALWYQSTSSFWSVMDAIDNGRIVPWMSASHSDEWGKCDFYDACFRYKFDEQAMKSKYVKITKGE